MLARNLIVNADDYNSDEHRSRGIIEAAEKGIVTSVSVIANLPFKNNSLQELKATFGSRIGVHLNLTKGKPLSSPALTLVNENGEFYKKKVAWRRAILHQYSLKEVEEEFAAQIYRLQELRIKPDHLDGNNHLHIFPGISKIVARLAQDFNIKKIRLPWEGFRMFKDFFQGSSFKKIFFGLLSQKVYPLFKSFDLIFPEHFFGIQFPRVSSIESLKKFFYHLPAGTTELMCHPGYRNESLLTNSDSPYEKELAALTHPEVANQIKQQKINLISYLDL